MKTIEKWLKISIAAAVILFMIEFGTLIHTAVNYREKYIKLYDDAVEAYNSENWDLVLYNLNQIPNVEGWGFGKRTNSREMIEYSKNMIMYNNAIQYIENGEYKKGYDILILLGEFKDSDKISSEIWGKID